MSMRMKQNFLIILLLSFCVQNCYAQILVKVQFIHKNVAGHNPKMFYSVDSIDQLINSISHIKVMNERAALANVGLPLIESNFGEAECEKFDTLKIRYDSLFRSSNTSTVIGENKDYKFIVQFLKAKYAICTFQVTYKIWASYDANFKSIGVVITSPSIEKFDEVD